MSLEDKKESASYDTTNIGSFIGIGIGSYSYPVYEPTFQKPKLQDIKDKGYAYYLSDYMAREYNVHYEPLDFNKYDAEWAIMRMEKFIKDKIAEDERIVKMVEYHFRNKFSDLR